MPKRSTTDSSSCASRVRCSARSTSSRCTVSVEALEGLLQAPSSARAHGVDLGGAGACGRPRARRGAARRGGERRRDPLQPRLPVLEDSSASAAAARARSRRRVSRALPLLALGPRPVAQRLGPPGDRPRPLLGGAQGEPPSTSARGRRRARPPRVSRVAVSTSPGVVGVLLGPWSVAMASRSVRSSSSARRSSRVDLDRRAPLGEPRQLGLRAPARSRRAARGGGPARRAGRRRCARRASAARAALDVGPPVVVADLAGDADLGARRGLRLPGGLERGRGGALGPLGVGEPVARLVGRGLHLEDSTGRPTGRRRPTRRRGGRPRGWPP